MCSSINDATMTIDVFTFHLCIMHQTLQGGFELPFPLSVVLSCKYTCTGIVKGA